ncbi:hypothetical protein Tco_1504276 [Tanacetum coccineum]
MTILFLSRLNDYYYKEKKGSYGPQFSKDYSYGASHINIPYLKRRRESPRVFHFYLCRVYYNVCFDNALADLGASVSVMPLSTYLNLGLGELAHTKLTVELADRTVKYLKGIAENVLVGIWQHVIHKLGVQLHFGHGHFDVPHVIDEFGKPDIVVVNGFSHVLLEVFKVIIQL